MSRPSTFTQTIADAICEQIADGKSLRSICLSGEMPDKSTVFRWLAANATFHDQYARAREAQADSLFEDTLDIADDGRRDYMESPDGPTVVDHDHIARARLRVDTRKWMAGKLKPKVYGERTLLEHSGPGGGPIQHEDSRDRNLNAIEELSARLPSATVGAAATASTGATDREPESGAVA